MRVSILSKSATASAATIAFALAVALLILVPTGHLVASAFFPRGTFQIGTALSVITHPATVQAIINTVIYVVGVSIISVLMGVPLAFLTERTDISGLAKQAIRLSVISALITPAFLVAMAYVNLLGPNAGVINVGLRALFNLPIDRGPINIYHIAGVLLLGAQQSVAFVYLIASASFSKMNPELEEAASISGARRWVVIGTVTLPVVRNSILAGGILSLATALADYGTPHMVGFTVLTLRIRSYMLQADFTSAAVVSLLLVLMSLLVLALYRKSAGSDGFATVTGKSFHPTPFRIGRAKLWLTGLAYLYAFLSVVLPVLGLLSTSLLDRLGVGFRLDNLTLRHYGDIIGGDGFVLRAISNSLILAASAAVICAVMAALIAYITMRRRSVTATLLDYVVVIPLGIAGTALAVALVMTVTNFPLRQLGLYGTLWILLLAYVIRHLPLAARPAQTSLSQISPELEQAARLAGAGWPRTMVTVTLPLIRPGVIAGAIIVFLASLTELSASIIVRHIGTDTIATAIMDLWDGGGGYQRASAVAVVVFVSMVALVVIAQFITGRSLYGDRTNP